MGFLRRLKRHRKTSTDLKEHGQVVDKQQRSKHRETGPEHPNYRQQGEYSKRHSPSVLTSSSESSSISGSYSSSDMTMWPEFSSHIQPADVPKNVKPFRAKNGGATMPAFQQNTSGYMQNIDDYAQNTYNSQHHAYPDPSNTSRRPAVNIRDQLERKRQLIVELEREEAVIEQRYLELNLALTDARAEALELSRTIEFKRRQRVHRHSTRDNVVKNRG